MKGHLCYTTRYNSGVTLRYDVVVFLVLTWTHEPCINKYCDFHYWWMAVAWYLTYQVKSNGVLKNIATHALCYVKICMTVEKECTYDVH